MCSQRRFIGPAGRSKVAVMAWVNGTIVIHRIGVKAVGHRGVVTDRSADRWSKNRLQPLCCFGLRRHCDTESGQSAQ
jgi:hypothetical protein